MTSARQRSNRRLGRGLASLITAPVDATTSAPTDPEHPASQPADAPPATGLIELPLDHIQPNAHQPRRDFDADALQSLADSIRAAGLVQPIVVRPRADQPDRYELVAGERRWRAAGIAGLDRLPAIVRNLSDQKTAEYALVENLQRADLNAMERAQAFASLLERFGLSQGDLADHVGMDRSSVANFLRLLTLPPQVQDHIRQSKLSFGHGRSLISITDNQLCITLAQRCIKEEWSVRKLEGEVAKIREGVRDEATHTRRERPANIIDLEERLSRHLGTKVALREGRKKGAGRIIIDFYDLDQFDGLLAVFGMTET
ncbi:MAG: ParB/RepB/Spo0J family partition protein [Phycisphaerales bacterium]|nr:ParB/RepB/Spo0J family partition protein [Phycisphaerales bacterium]